MINLEEVKSLIESSDENESGMPALRCKTSHYGLHKFRRFTYKVGTIVKTPMLTLPVVACTEY